MVPAVVPRRVPKACNEPAQGIPEASRTGIRGIATAVTSGISFKTGKESPGFRPRAVPCLRQILNFRLSLRIST